MRPRANIAKAKPAKKVRKPATKKANGKAKPTAKASKSEESERRNFFPRDAAFTRRWNAELEKNHKILHSNKKVLKEHKGEYVLMRHGDIVDYYSTRMGAIDAGFARYEDVIFSALHIPDPEFPYVIPSVFVKL